MDDSLVSLVEIVLCRGARTMLKEQHREALIRGKEGFVEEAFSSLRIRKVVFPS